MDDLSEKLDRLLGSPEGMKRVEEMMAALGVSPPAVDTPPAPEPPTTGSGGVDIGMMLKLLPLLEKLRAPNDDAALLNALRPHLKAPRQKRLDEAGQMLNILRLMPLIKELKEDDGHE